mmetsp:Transcript_17726/g.31010  ORF Transcript_17726/g.31010 Transcript_17726/m.31010 type:complete len:207 (+) Transcript_17726:837-1457(+)
MPHRRIDFPLHGTPPGHPSAGSQQPPGGRVHDPIPHRHASPPRPRQGRGDHSSLHRDVVTDSIRCLRCQCDPGNCHVGSLCGGVHSLRHDCTHSCSFPVPPARWHLHGGGCHCRKAQSPSGFQHTQKALHAGRYHLRHCHRCCEWDRVQAAGLDSLISTWTPWDVGSRDLPLCNLLLRAQLTNRAEPAEESESEGHNGHRNWQQHG